MLRTLLTGLLLFPAIAFAANNDLYKDPSPYLAMHGSDPVQWHHWDSAAIAQAKKDNKLLFVSIGYFSCHWCHVMQRESYQNESTAAILNRHFVSVKVDRELDPGLDARLIEFVERTRGYSGWPLNVFITPDGYPLLGVVYMPPEEFKGLLNQLNDLWQQDPEGLRNDARTAAQELAPKPLNKTAVLSDDVADKASVAFVGATLGHADQFMGGFGEQGKFPSVPQLMALLNQQEKRPADNVQKFLRTTLNNMIDLGLRDHIGGGFFRYTVDPQWRVPHFEKMLYDNALLASLYFRAAEVLGEQRYKLIAIETLGFMRDELLTKRGALAASLSALDDKGVEGGYYLWQKDELKKILDAEQYKLVEEAWSLKGSPTTEDGYLPLLSVPLDELGKSAGQAESAITARLVVIQKRLRDLRNKRIVPRDDKQLAAWNGLALSAFAEGLRQDPKGGWQNPVTRIRDYIVNSLWDGKQLLRSTDARGKAVGTVTLTDYAVVAQALLDSSEITGNKVDRELAEKLIGRAWELFVNEYGFRRTEKSLLALPEGEVIIADSPIYSPSALLLKTTMRAFDKDHPLSVRARKMLASGERLMLEDPYWFATQVDTLLQNKNALH